MFVSEVEFMLHKKQLKRDKKRPNRIRCTSVYGLPHRTTPRQKVQ